MRWLARTLFLLALVAGVGIVAYWLLDGQEPADTRFTGAYRLTDGELVIIAPREGDVLRYRVVASGESRALYPAGPLRYQSGPGWSVREPVEVELAFEMSPNGTPVGFTWSRSGASAETGRRLDLPEMAFRFPSGELSLRGKLVEPLGDGPFPAVVLVHGSGTESAVDTHFMPYLFAAHGVATLVYDKRGTGESDGSYTQNFDVLADDVAAAIEWLRGRSRIDSGRIHLAGFSQGGWIAPLAAQRTGLVRSLLVGYGPLVPVTAEDRWGYVYALEQSGFGAEAVREADRINEVVGRIFDHRENRWAELAGLLREARGAPWYDAVRGSDSVVGLLTGTRMPLWLIRLYFWWRFGRAEGEPFIDRLFDPQPVVAALEVPSLWIYGGEDSSMPTGWSIEVLEELRAGGRPIEIRVFPGAEHGILVFEETAAGERVPLGYAPGYLTALVDWLRRQSGLAG